MASRAEQTRDQWATALEGITLANGYRNTVSVSRAIPTIKQVVGLSFPHVAIEFGRSVMEFKDSTWTIHDELVDVHIAGYVTADTETGTLEEASYMMHKMEGLIADLQRKICNDLLTVNSNHATNPWVVSTSGKKLEFQRLGRLYEGKNYGMIQTMLVVRLKNKTISEDDTFLRQSDGQIITDSRHAPIELE